MTRPLVPLGNALGSTLPLKSQEGRCLLKVRESGIDEKEETTELKYGFKTSYSCGLETYATKICCGSLPQEA